MPAELGTLLARLRRAAAPDSLPSDRELLERFAARRDEAAFAALVARHGPLVRGACGRLLPDEQDAEDVFQATFLVLARKAAAVRWRESVAAWLYEVATRLARKARAAAARRRAREQRLTESPRPAAAPDPTWREVAAAVDEELARLAERHRAPLLLCLLGGATQDEAARRLGWSGRTLRRRLAEGRALLQARLTRRGLALSAALLATGLARPATAAVSAGTAAGLAGKAAEFAADETSVAGAAAALARAALRAGPIRATVASVGLAVCLTAAGLGASLARPAPAGQSGDGEATPAEREIALAQPAPRVDRDGVALPAGVLARMGSGRMRTGGYLRGIAFAPDGRSLATTAQGGVDVWDAATGKLRCHVDAPTDWSGAFAFAAAGTVLRGGGEKGFEIRTWDAGTGRELARVALKGVPEVYTAAFTPDGRRLAVAHGARSVRVHDGTTGAELARIPIKGRGAFGISFSADGKTVAHADGTDTVRVHDAATGKPVQELKREKAQFGGVALSPDGRTLAALTRDPGDPADDAVTLWDVPSGKERCRLKGTHWFEIFAAFSPDGRVVATGGQGDDVILWDAASGKELRRLRTWPSAVGGTFSPDGKTLAVASSGGTVTLWDVASGKLLPQSADPITGVGGLRFSADGKQLFGSADTLLAWDPATGRELRRYPAVRTAHGAAVLSPDGTLLATFDQARVVKLWDAATGAAVRELKGHEAFGWALLFSPDGRRLFSGSWDKTARVWDVGTGKELRKLGGHGGMVDRLAVSPDGRLLATASTDASARGDYAVRLWDVDSGKELRRFTPGRGSAFDVQFSPDGRLLATVGGDPGRLNTRGEVELWDVETGKRVRAFEGHKERVTRVAFAPDGRSLATGSQDHTFRVWELATGRERHRFTGHVGPVHELAFSPDGWRLAAASADAPVFVWEFPGPAGGGAPTAGELTRAWADLGSGDAEAGFRAVRRLAAAPDAAVALLRERMRAAPPADAARVAKLIGDLDSDRFAARDAAEKELAVLGEAAAPGLRKALAGDPPAEVRRRVTALLEKLTPDRSPEQLRAVRAAEALEYAATPAARKLLEEWAAGPEGVRRTEEAKASLGRIARRPAP